MMTTELVENGHAQEYETDLIPQRSTFVESQARGEVDTQISTARRYPRSVKMFRQKALSLATLDEDTAASCFYSLPRGGKPIEGPSARLAEIVAISWGNLRSQANVVDVDDKWVTARGVCWDLEANVAISVEVRRRITDKNGKRYNDDMIGVTSNAACAIALRNAVFKVVPMAMAKPIYDAARKVAIGDAETLAARRGKMVQHFGKMGVQPDQICTKVGRASVDDITLDDLGTLIGLATAIKDGDTTVDEAFAVEPKNGGDSGKPKSERMAEQLKKPASKPKEQPNHEQTTDELEIVSEAEAPQPDSSEYLIREGEEPTKYVGRLKAAIQGAQSADVLASVEAGAQACFEQMKTAEYDAIERALKSRRAAIEKASESGSLIA